MINNPTDYDSLAAFITNLVDLAISLSVLIAVVALIIAGFKYILAMGDEEKVENATKSLIFALVGLVIVFLAPLLVEYITSLIVVS
jgi:type IV secretory pathway VirB2 component (pilin)